MPFGFFFSIKNNHSMGQSAFSCNIEQPLSSDLLERELKIYRWRADPNCNTHIPKVSFKSARSQKEEENFAQFLKTQAEKEYLEIYKFQQQAEQLHREQQDEQIIIFEKYEYCLAQLSGLLSLQEAVYTLHTLLLGYEELKRMYERFVLDGSCCFVTKEGNLRVWVNPNCKNNQIWTGERAELYPQSNISAIIAQSIDLVERIAAKNEKAHQFIWTIRSAIGRITLKNHNFIEIRKLINQYIFINNLNVSRGLSAANDKMKWQEQLDKAKMLEEEGKKLNMVLSTVESQLKATSQQKSLLLKSKSLESHTIKQGEPQKPCLFKVNKSPKPTPFTFYNNAQPTVSQIIPQNWQKINQPAKYSQIVNRSNHLLKEMKEQPMNCQFLKNVTDFKMNQPSSETFKNSSGILKNKLPKVPSVKSSFLVSNELQIESKPNKFIKKDTVQIEDLSKKQSKNSDKKPKTIHQSVSCKKAMQVSLVQYMDELDKPQKAETVRRENHFRTQMERHSVESASGSDNWSRPWITTKTITKLISQNDNENGSYKNSIGDSSDCYNGSIYSGVLTQMGRAVVTTKTDRRSREI